jgi:hypothetical protein
MRKYGLLRRAWFTKLNNRVMIMVMCSVGKWHRVVFGGNVRCVIQLRHACGVNGKSTGAALIRIHRDLVWPFGFAFSWGRVEVTKREKVVYGAYSHNDERGKHE